ncbi:hypothetical protein E5288_WYG003644 [Bos mutus]|uniref:Uncharacterized protein n=1 Tax=Bos mutus TaxID=72004 RepID=A0A6B0RWT6_9CETA|nr:hypothetical protein [Bos mutus]
MAEPQLDVKKPSGEHKQGDSNQQLPTDPGDNAKPADTCPELVLKVRIQSHKENDFIEVELDRQELSYQNLLQVSCYELGINPEQVEKIRKLPNTLLRKVSPSEAHFLPKIFQQYSYKAKFAEK